MVPEDLPNYVTRTQLCAARVLLNLDRGGLAKAAGVSETEVFCLETGRFVRSAPIGLVVFALQGAGVRFVSEEEEVGVVLLTPKPADVISLENYRNER
jgi:hypothetical protein